MTTTTVATTLQENFALLKSPKKVLSLTLGDIKPLYQMPLAGVSVVSRAIDEANLQSLMLAEEFPPVLVTPTSEGYYMVDGQHRYQAAVNQGFVEFCELQGNWPLVDGKPAPMELETIKEILTVEGKVRGFSDEEKEFILARKIRCQAVGFDSPVEVVRFAWRANSTHGMPPKKEALGQYGSWLYRTLHALDAQYSYADAAREAGCSKATILNWQARQMKKASTAGEDASGSSEGEIDVADKFARQAAGLIRKVGSIDCTADQLALKISDYLKVSDSASLELFQRLMGLTWVVLREEKEAGISED
jgi:hypothetical protein